MKNTTFYNDEYIVSYNSNKTWIEEINNNYVFKKISNLTEVININKMNEILLNKNIIIDNKSFSFKVPKIIDFSDDVISLEYCSGMNLEFYLRDITTHDKGVTFINELLKFLIKNKIYWSDFAPRNIILNNDTITFVDFEKGIMNNNSEIKDYLRYHVYEEYSLFLLPNERIIDQYTVFNMDNEEDILIDVDSISSDRFKYIAKLKGFDKCLAKSEYLDIIKTVLEVEEPYYEKNDIVYPGVILDKYMINTNSDNPVMDYAKEIIKMHYKIKTRK